MISSIPDRQSGCRALDYLTKPYDEEELFAVLETAVFQVKKQMEAEKQEAEDRPAGGTPKSCETRGCSAWNRRREERE